MVLTETGAVLSVLPLSKVSGRFAVAAAAVSAGVCVREQAASTMLLLDF